MSGQQLQAQLKLLGYRNCSWKLCTWNYPELSVVGARPCSPGGGYYLSPQVQALFGPVPMEQSINRIVSSSEEASTSKPLILLAHSGPTGLGSDSSSPCGRDWKLPAIDWGDQDLAIAIDKIHQTRSIELVVFGHMHHHLSRNQGYRKTFSKDNFGTFYLNAACVPRRGKDNSGAILSHFSWVEFLNGKVNHISHRWYKQDLSIAYEEILFSS